MPRAAGRFAQILRARGRVNARMNILTKRLSIGMHAFPSTTDLSHLWAQAPALAKKGNVLAIVSLPLAAVLVVLNYARVVWADLGYGIAVGVLGPIAIFRALAR